MMSLNPFFSGKLPVNRLAHFVTCHSKAIVFIAISALVICRNGSFELVFDALGLPSAQAATAGSNTKPALTVTTAQPQSATLGLQLAANGNIAAWQEAVVGSQANGLMLKEVLVNIGDPVRKGQVLARFADESVAADLAQAKAVLAEAQAAAEDARANAERARSLQNTDALSAQQLAQFATADKTAQARLDAAQAALAAQQVRMGHVEVLAPDSGIISARAATVGAVIGAGTELFRLLRQGRLEWRAEVTSSELAQIRPGTQATLTAASGVQVKGRVRMVAPTVDPQTRAAMVYVDIPAMNGSGAVLPGMFAKGTFELGSSVGLTVPQQAVVIRDGFSTVFKLGADQRVTQLKVQTGRRHGTQVELLSGLAANDTIVVSGAGFLNDGDVVKVASPAAKGRPEAGAVSVGVK